MSKLSDPLPPAEHDAATKEPTGTPPVPLVPQDPPKARPKKKRTVRGVRRSVATPAKRPQGAGMARAPKDSPGPGRPVDGRAALAKIAEQGEKEGIRVFWLGRTGAGKTTVMRCFLRMMTDSGAVSLIHDTKNKSPDFPGACVANVEAAQARGLRHGEPGFVFRGDFAADIDVSPADVAHFAIDTSRKSGGRVRLVTVIGELDDALTDAGRAFEGENKVLGTVIRKGRTQDISLLGTYQDPFRSPRNLKGMASAIIWMSLLEEEMAFVRNRGMSTPLANALEKLPPYHFLIQTPEGWDGAVYTIPEASGAMPRQTRATGVQNVSDGVLAAPGSESETHQED